MTWVGGGTGANDREARGVSGPLGMGGSRLVSAGGGRQQHSNQQRSGSPITARGSHRARQGKARQQTAQQHTRPEITGYSVANPPVALWLLFQWFVYSESQ